MQSGFTVKRALDDENKTENDASEKESLTFLPFFLVWKTFTFASVEWKVQVESADGRFLCLTPSTLMARP